MIGPKKLAIIRQGLEVAWPRPGMTRSDGWKIA